MLPVVADGVPGRLEDVGVATRDGLLEGNVAVPSGESQISQRTIEGWLRKVHDGQDISASVTLGSKIGVAVPEDGMLPIESR